MTKKNQNSMKPSRIDIEKYLEEAEEVIDLCEDMNDVFGGERSIHNLYDINNYQHVISLLNEILNKYPVHKTALKYLQEMWECGIRYFHMRHICDEDFAEEYPIEYEYFWEYIEEEVHLAYHNFINTSLTIMVKYPEEIKRQESYLMQSVFKDDMPKYVDPYLYFLKFIVEDTLPIEMPSENKKLFVKLLKSKKWQDKYSSSSFINHATNEEFDETLLKIKNSKKKRIPWEEQFEDIVFYNAELKLRQLPGAGKIRGEITVGEMLPIEYEEQHYLAFLYLARKAKKALKTGLIETMKVTPKELEDAILYKETPTGKEYRSPKTKNRISGIISQLKTPFNAMGFEKHQIIYGGGSKKYWRLNFYPEKITITE